MNRINQTTPLIKKRRSYSLKFKLSALNELEKNNNNFQNTAERLGISRQCLMNWNEQKEKINESNYKTIRQRLPISVNKALFPDMENTLDKWIKDNRDKGVCISGFSIKVKAIEIMRGENPDVNSSPFMASDGWFSNFLKRKNLSLRRITTTGRSLPQNALNTIKEFIDNCANLFTNINRAQIINMDEIGVYIDYPSNYTYDHRGIF
jgi:hypothetical protein